jgi:formamidopyrimidine-DNA glycosylase
VDLLTDRGQVVRYNDPRRFGSLHWVPGPVEEHPLLRHLGPEPLSPEFTVDWLWAQTRTRSIWIVPRTLKFGITGQF